MLQPIPFTDVTITDAFWAPRREINRAISLPMSLDKLEEAGNLENLDLAASGAADGHRGPVFADSDIYKALEAVAYSLATHPDPEIEQRLDAVIEQIAAAQCPDGYLNTYYQVTGIDKRWTNLRDNHELYCAGHLFEAAAAHFQATGKRTLLKIASRFADHIDCVFGEGEGRGQGYPGHPEIELALVKLWQVTGEKRYFDLASFFVRHRGEHFFAQEHDTPREDYHGEYWQDHLPILEHSAIVGHAVRAAYLYSGVVEIAAETGDHQLLDMAQRVWEYTTTRRMYVTGGIGSSAHNEGFTQDYDLPNLTAYQETCASIAMMMFSHRLNLVTRDAKYADIVELALYNGFLAGVSLDGRRYFYVNPLASEGTHHRQEWFGCACCPPNVTRTLAMLGQYAYAVSDDAIWVNLYMQGTATARVGSTKLLLGVTSNYPWSGEMALTVTPEKATEFSLNLRIPGWCENAVVSVNREAIDVQPTNGYISISRKWHRGDTVHLDLAMPVRRLVANPRVQEDRGCTALMRGPLVYCIEDADNDGRASSTGVPLDSEFHSHHMPSLLGGVVTLEGAGEVSTDFAPFDGLYQTAPARRGVSVTAIPYYAWDNRAPGGMRVWLPAVPTPAFTEDPG